MHSESGNIKIMIQVEADEVTKKPFGSLKKRYENNLQSTKDREFVFDYVDLLYYYVKK